MQKFLDLYKETYREEIYGRTHYVTRICAGFIVSVVKEDTDNVLVDLILIFI